MCASGALKMKSNKIEKKIMVICFALCLICFLIKMAGAGKIGSSLECTDIEGEPCFDPVEDDWYDVHDWELDVCMKWGGPENTIAGSSSYSKYINQLTATIQAEKETIVDNKTLYKYSYYVMPATPDKKVNYSIELVNSSLDNKNVLVGNVTANGHTGAGAYDALELDQVYDRIRLVMNPGGVLTVPVMYEDYEPGCEGCGFN